ncbi:hypothetical protein KIPB_015005, partial [Kipferlia bialata]|eukprot:g15005.t1
MPMPPFLPGQLVWAKIQDYPFWPCDIVHFSSLPTDVADSVADPDSEEPEIMLYAI